MKCCFDFLVLLGRRNVIAFAIVQFKKEMFFLFSIGEPILHTQCDSG